jgi:ABC-type transport system involved in multi-copper enzyme maturation permease subunit
MLSLMKLEMQKMKFRWFPPSALIVILAITGLSFPLYFSEALGEIPEFGTYEQLFAMIGTFTRVAFVVYGGTLISRLVISEYKSKTISVLFMYPVSRKKLLSAKLLLVVLWTFSAIVVSTALITSFFLILDRQVGNIPEALTQSQLVEHAIQTVVHAAASACMCLISLFFGMRKKSVPVTIVSATVIAAIVNSNNGDFTLSSIVAVPLTLAAIGLGIAWLTISKVDQTDVV